MPETIYNLMGFTAKTLDGRTPAAMNDGALGLASAVYMNDIWSSTGNNPRIDVNKIIAQCNCLPWGTLVMLDTEILVQKMRIAGGAGGGWQPNPDRLTYQMEFVRARDAIRSTTRGQMARICWFHSCVSAVHPANSSAWFGAWRTSNETMIEPIPGSATGVLGMADVVVGRCYSEYRDQATDVGAHLIVADELRRLTPTKPTMGLFQPRKSGADWNNEIPPNRFDYLSRTQIKGRLEACRGKFNLYGLWNSGHYGPPGWTVRNANFYAVAAPGSNTVVGDEFAANADWYLGVDEFRRGGPVVTTIPAPGGGVSTGGTSGR